MVNAWLLRDPRSSSATIGSGRDTIRSGREKKVERGPQTTEVWTRSGPLEWLSADRPYRADLRAAAMILAVQGADVRDVTRSAPPTLA